MRQITSPIKFGTDGWRGIIAQDFTFDNVRACAQGVAGYLKQTGLSNRGLIIGYDNRFASEDFAAAAAEAAAANDIKVYLCHQAAPTPVISYGVLSRQAGGAIIITASHNPAIWNGFKFKSETGSSAPPEVTAEIEKLIAGAQATGKTARLPLAKALNQNKVEYIDLDQIYFDQVSKLVDLNAIRRAGLKAVFDPMYGSGIGYFNRLLGGGNLKLTEINSRRNPLFPGIRPEPIAINLKKLSTTVKRKRADAGIATDGDADRIGIIDEKGRFLTQLQVYTLLAYYLLEVRGQRGAIVKTITSSSMLNHLGEIYKVPVFETAVGFKYVAPVMVKEDALIGGEESGGYGFRGHVVERDGILAGLFFLDLLVKTGKKPSELIDQLYDKVGPHHYKRLDIEFPEEKRQDIIKRVQASQPEQIDGVKVVEIDTADGFRFILADSTWLLIRFSGTEPLLRIYTETDSPERLERLLKIGKGLAGV